MVCDEKTAVRLRLSAKNPTRQADVESHPSAKCAEGWGTRLRNLGLLAFGGSLRESLAYVGQAAAQICHRHINRTWTVDSVNVCERNVILSGQPFAIVQLQ